MYRNRKGVIRHFVTGLSLFSSSWKFVIKSVFLKVVFSKILGKNIRGDQGDFFIKFAKSPGPPYDFAPISAKNFFVEKTLFQAENAQKFSTTFC
jgi:hypothetical protein